MEWMDFFVITGLEWLYDGVERRLGPVAAWIVTFASVLAVVAATVAVLVTIR